MATLSVIVSNTVIGDLRMKIAHWTASGTAETLDLGIGSLTAAQVSPKSLASFVNSGSTRNIAVVGLNVGATGTATVGNLALTGTIANDVYVVVAYAKS